MAHIFIRVELRGSLTLEDYENLDSYVENNH